ncbi:MAG: ribbon-helix-helix domain-containing protein [Maricaulaceae bacterium]
MQKRSVTLSGHRTSVALEPEFWAALEVAAHEAGKPLARLIAEIDEARANQGGARGLASALRVWLLHRALQRCAAMEAAATG